TVTLTPTDAAGVPTSDPQTRILSTDAGGHMTVRVISGVPGQGESSATITPDANGTGTHVEVNEPAPTTDPNAPPLTVTEDIDTTADGQQTVTAFATDGQGNRVGPLLNVAFGQDGSITSIDGLSLSGKASGVLDGVGFSLFSGDVTISGGP